MNFADCCTNELEFRICTNCNNIQYKVYKPFEKNVNVYYQRLLTYQKRLLLYLDVNPTKAPTVVARGTRYHLSLQL